MKVSKLLSTSVLFAAGLGAGLPAMGRDEVPRSTNASRQAMSQQRVLIVSATDNQATDQGIVLATEALDKQGVAYDRYIATQAGEIQANQQLSLESSGGVPRYSAILLTNDKLLFENNQGQWVSGLSNEQWSELQKYEAKNQVKRLALYSSPSTEMGVELVGQANGEAVELVASQEVSATLPEISQLAQAGRLQLANSWRYPAQVVDQNIAKPILYFKDVSAENQQSVAAALVKTQDGREQMHFFFSQGKNVEVSNLLTPLWMEWLAPNRFKGVWSSTFEGFESQTGKVTVSEVGHNFQVAANLGQLRLAGPAMLIGGRLIAGWNEKDQDIGIAALHMSQNGGMVGTMINGASSQDLGTVAIQGMSLESLNGQFDFSAESQALGQIQGTVEVVAKGDTYEMAFVVQDFKFKGIGIRSGDHLVLSMATGKNFGVVEYTNAQADAATQGRVVQGRWLRYGLDRVFAQTLRQSAQ